MRFEPPTYEQIPTVAGMVAAMDREVSGLETVKPRLALCLRRFMVAAVHDHPRPAQNLIVLAPTGSGKTHVLRCLLAAVPAISCEVNATEYSDVGYRGRDLTSMYLGLMDARWRGAHLDDPAPWRQQEMTALAERWGIVVIDEFDKIRASKTPGANDREVGRVLQAELLKLVEGTAAICRRNDEDRGTMINTAGILHIAVGAFQGLNSIVFKDLQEAGIGVKNQAHAYEKASAANLIDYGFLEELIGRFSTIIALPPLSSGHLARIFREHVVPPVQVQCADDGIDLEVREDAVATAGNEAMGFRIGARALGNLLEECISKQWAQAQPGDRLILDAQGVIHKTCTLIPHSAAA